MVIALPTLYPHHEDLRNKICDALSQSTAERCSGLIYGPVVRQASSTDSVMGATEIEGCSAQKFSQTLTAGGKGHIANSQRTVVGA